MLGRVLHTYGYVWSSSFIFPLMLALFFFYMMNIYYSSFSVVSWVILVSEFEFGSVFLLDWLSISFIFTVGVVSASVLIYSMEYMQSSLMKKKFIITMMFFIMSMFLLSVSADFFWLMVGWDGLGLSSFCLIVFFQNWKSFNSSMITFLTNRLGDCCIIISLFWIMLYSPVSWVEGGLVSIFLLLGAFSKSAQMPFSAWLPLAMAAPTPVSSLVHSSTLVTAGVFMIIRFNGFFESVKKEMFFLSSLTILLSGSSSLGEFDLKKVIALSTLSHIGLMIFFVSLGGYTSALVHLMVHAFFKSLLFMVSGIYIHSNSSNQDVRNVGLLSANFPLSSTFLVSLSSMVGMPFLAGFFSKEKLFFSMIEEFDFVKMVFFFFSIAFTCSYSLRMIVYTCKNLLVYDFKEESSMDWMIFYLMSFFCVMSSLIISSNQVLTGFSMSSMLSLKFVLFLFMFIGFMVGNLSYFFTNLGIYFLIQKMWFILSLMVFFQKNLFQFSWDLLFKLDSKGMLDYIFFSLVEKMSMMSKFFFTISLNCTIIFVETSLLMMVLYFYI